MLLRCKISIAQLFNNIVRLILKTEETAIVDFGSKVHKAKDNVMFEIIPNTITNFT